MANIEGAIAALEAGGISKGPMSGIEMALWDAMGKGADLPVCKLLGGVVREEVDFCACMGLKAPSESAATAREYMERWGFRFLKTKAGDDSQQDLQIAEAIQAAVGDEAILRPDANSGYSPAEAEVTMRKMKDLGIRYFEDPCSPEYLDALIRCRTEIGMGILVNMGVSTADSVVNLLANEGC